MMALRPTEKKVGTARSTPAAERHASDKKGAGSRRAKLLTSLRTTSSTTSSCRNCVLGARLHQLGEWYDSAGMASRFLLVHVASDELQQLGTVDRLAHEVVAAGLEALPAIVGHGVSGERENG